MIPYLRLWQRFVAWLIWHFEGYEGMTDARFYIFDNPDITRTASLMRDYWYVKNARDYDHD